MDIVDELADIKYGSTIGFEQLPEKFQLFWSYMEENTDLSERTIKNYVNSIHQLFNIGLKEVSEKSDVGTQESIEMIEEITKIPEFHIPVKIGLKEAINYFQMNLLWNHNYSASLHYYYDYVESLKVVIPQVYAIRTNQAENVESIETPGAVFTFDGIYNYQNDLKNNIIIFSVLGGDKPKWETGFKSIGKITRPPFDIGYNDKGRNTYFRIEIENHLVFDNTVTREDFYNYPDTINAPFIGPTTKGEANQAIRKLEDGHVLGIIKGIIDYYPDYYEKMVELFSLNTVNYAMNHSIKLVESIENEVINDELDSTIDEKLKIIVDETKYINDWEQKIFYGAPGTGKSYRMKQEYSDFKRVTFHPEYSFTDFIGGLRPVQEKQISYQFVSGPLTDSIIEALKNPDKKIGLIIEEINRGNTAAIFGDTFQLLDRDDLGWSEYGIVNKEVLDYLALNDIFVEDIKLPSNLSIIATMNNADQGIYVMDSAFKRRWEFLYMPIDFKNSIHRNEVVAGFKIKWSEFGEILNDHLSSIGVEEDKLIGQYFLTKDEIGFEDKVASKLFIYLWDDVVRYNREAVFAQPNNFSKLLELYKSDGRKIFSKQLKDKLPGVADE